MGILYYFLGLAVVSMLAIALAAAWEKRQVWPYVPAATVPPEQVPPLSDYVNEAAAAAMGMGFAPRGVFIDGKGKMYRIRYDFFRAPGGEVLALVGSGTVASMSVQTTWLYTLLSNGQCLVTIDNQSGGEIDLANLSKEALCKNTGFAGLLAFHGQRLATTTIPILPFSATNPLDDLRRYRQGRMERLAALGYASFLDAERNVWRYSPKGAVNLAGRQYVTGMRRSFVPDKNQVSKGAGRNIT